MHRANISILADQEIEILGRTINIHEIQTLCLDPNGKIIEVILSIKKTKDER